MTRMTKHTSGLWVPADANINNHTHLDCNLGHDTCLDLWHSRGFHTSALAFPEAAVNLFTAAKLLEGAPQQKGTRLNYRAEARRLRREATRIYRRHCFAMACDLDEYVAIIRDQCVPIMQTAAELTRITRENVEDLVRDHTIAAQLRFAPQYHTRGGLSLDQVMDAVIEGIKDAPIPIKLILCVLRHENQVVARQVGDLCLRYQDWVGAIDLAGGEESNPGVLPWYLEEALRVRELSQGRIQVTLHIGETRPATAEDLRLIKENGIKVCGHFLHNDDPDVYQEVCIDSNVLLKNAATFRAHNVDRKLREGQRVMLSTDGTTLINTSQRSQMRKARRYWGWGAEQFLQVNLNAIEASYFDEATKEVLRRQIRLAHGS